MRAGAKRSRTSAAAARRGARGGRVVGESASRRPGRRGRRRDEHARSRRRAGSPGRPPWAPPRRSSPPRPPRARRWAAGPAAWTARRRRRRRRRPARRRRRSPRADAVGDAQPAASSCELAQVALLAAPRRAGDQGDGVARPRSGASPSARTSTSWPFQPEIRPSTATTNASARQPQRLARRRALGAARASIGRPSCSDERRGARRRTARTWRATRTAARRRSAAGAGRRGTSARTPRRSRARARRAGRRRCAPPPPRRASPTCWCARARRRACAPGGPARPRRPPTPPPTREMPRGDMSERRSTASGRTCTSIAGAAQVGGELAVVGQHDERPVALRVQPGGERWSWRSAP